MTRHDDAPSDDELHAFVDGQLAAARMPALLDWLHAHPDDAARVAAWQAQRLALRRLHRATDVGATPPALLRPLDRLRRRRASLYASAAVLLLGVGLVVGRLTAPGTCERAPALAAAGPAFVRDAAVAYAVYTPEVRHPVEVGAADEAHLVQWLTKRLGAPLKAPSLLEQGFRLLGGRLLPGADGPRAQFMYESAAGQRVTLYVTVFDPRHPPAETAFRSVRDGAVESFYWVDGRMGYAFSAALPPADAMAIATAVYLQLSH
ncbi:MAG: hypothetical protein ABT20_13305 [Rubrivivax sp. SCN 70-15]|nr:MAG: hypothetical protein ABT20_13305 [Rubrivivax sp. SCN 70-15]